jgi:translation initiation factor IF-3
VNHAIKAPVVRVVGENLESPGIFPIKDAIKMAEELELDLVEISPMRVPRFAKSLITRNSSISKNANKRAESKTAKIVVKEIRFDLIQMTTIITLKMKHAQEIPSGWCQGESLCFLRTVNSIQ